MATTHKKPRVSARASKDSQPRRISLVVPPSLRTQIAALAKTEKRTLNAQCTVLLERGLKALAA